MSKPSEAAVADVFFALGDPTRLSMMRRLGSSGALTATALCRSATISRQAITKHLRVLEGAGLVSHEKRGREVLFTLERARLERARGHLDALSALWDRRLGRLQHLVEGDPP